MMTYRDHLLVILMEECSEVAQACSKSLRFGLESGYPDRKSNNLDDLREELSQLIAVVDMLESDLLTTYDKDAAALFDSAEAKKKKESVLKYLELSRSNGRLRVT